MDALKNFPYGTIATAPTPATSGTTFSFATGIGAKMPAVPFTLVVHEAGAKPEDTNAENIRITAMSGDNVTACTRGFEGTTPRIIVVGDECFAAQTKAWFDELISALGEGYNRSTVTRFFDDFLYGAAATSPPYWLASMASGTVANDSSDESRRGVIQFTTSGSASGRANYSLNASSIIFGSGAVVYEQLIKIDTLSDASQEFAATFGFSDLFTGTPAFSTDAISFLYDRAGRGNGNWWVVVASNASRAYTDTTVAVDTNWVKLRIEVNADATEVKFYIDGTLVHTASSGIPAGTSRLSAPSFGIFKSVGTTARTFKTDYVYLEQQITTPR